MLIKLHDITANLHLIIDFNRFYPVKYCIQIGPCPTLKNAEKAVKRFLIFDSQRGVNFDTHRKKKPRDPRTAQTIKFKIKNWGFHAVCTRLTLIITQTKHMYKFFVIIIGITTTTKQ